MNELLLLLLLLLLPSYTKFINFIILLANYIRGAVSYNIS